jgi:hypothetical protein
LLVAFLLLLAEPLVGERRPTPRRARSARWTWPWRRRRTEEAH